MKIPTAIRGELLLHAGRARPAEAVGLLLVDGEGQAVHYFPLANVADDEARFELADFDLALWHALEQRWGAELVLFHAHPDTPAHPSHRDLAYGREAQRVVLLGDGFLDLRAFRFDRHRDDRLSGRLRATEIPLSIV